MGETDQILQSIHENSIAIYKRPTAINKTLTCLKMSYGIVY
jgi:hypothetical protein